MPLASPHSCRLAPELRSASWFWLSVTRVALGDVSTQVEAAPGTPRCYLSSQLSPIRSGWWRCASREGQQTPRERWAPYLPPEMKVTKPSAPSATSSFRRTPPNPTARRRRSQSGLQRARAARARRWRKCELTYGPRTSGCSSRLPQSAMFERGKPHSQLAETVLERDVYWPLTLRATS